MFSNALVDLFGGAFNIRGDAETIERMIENKWKDLCSFSMLSDLGRQHASFLRAVPVTGA